MSSAKKRFVIAIDGPAGSGKSTIARLVARRLGYRYVDTGAMYRAVAWKALKDGIPLDAAGRLARAAGALRLRFERSRGAQRVLVAGRDVTQDIRSEAVSRAASRVAAVQGVRRALRRRQKKMSRGGGVVMEGRDIGTAVCPRADFKFYLDASALERARRRHRQLLLKDARASLPAVAGAIRLRDRQDKSRGINPLKPAPDALRLDSTRMSQEDVVRALLRRIRPTR
jgi:CMP/dCMP kinase